MLRPIKCTTREIRDELHQECVVAHTAIHSVTQHTSLLTLMSIDGWMDEWDKQTDRYKKGSPYSITKRRVPELIPVLGSHPAGDVSHKPGGRLSLLSTRPAVTLATPKRAATNFTASINRGAMGVNSLPKTVTRKRHGCDLNLGPSAPESSMLTTRLPSQTDR